MPDIFLRPGATNPSDPIARDPTKGTFIAAVAQSGEDATQSCSASIILSASVSQSGQAAAQLSVLVQDESASVSQSGEAAVQASVLVQEEISSVAQSGEAAGQSVSATENITVAVAQSGKPATQAVVGNAGVMSICTVQETIAAATQSSVASYISKIKEEGGGPRPSGYTSRWWDRMPWKIETTATGIRVVRKPTVRDQETIVPVPRFVARVKERTQLAFDSGRARMSTSTSCQQAAEVPHDLLFATLKTEATIDQDGSAARAGVIGLARQRFFAEVREGVRDSAGTILKRLGGRVYSAGTAEGFQRMRDRGIPVTPFNLEDRLSRVVMAEYDDLFRGLITETVRSGRAEGFKIERSESGQALVQDADPNAVRQKLRNLMGQRGPAAQKLRLRLNSQLVAVQRDFFEQFMGDADRRTVDILLGKSISSGEAFQSRIAGLRELYLDQAVERIAGEADDLKKRFLQKLVDWAEGRTNRLEVSKLMEEMKETSGKRAKFFARDQFSRFNRALLVETYRQAEAPWVEWLTVSDQRVRPVPPSAGGPGNYHGLPLGNHRVRNHRIYTIDGLLDDPEYKSYGCRCGYVPRYELTRAMIGRIVA